ncbi:MAG TPA: YIP1 family protein [Kofleriaceae bacterium]|nr:YIP1 family protein [Kofleriaceae bacterium]
MASALLAPLVALLFPDRGVPPMVAAGRFRIAMAMVIAAALLAAAAVSVRVDVGPAVRAENAGAPPPPSAGAPAPEQPMGEAKTDREIDEEIAKRTAVTRVKLGLGAALGTPTRIVLLALALFLLGRYLGGKTTFQRALAAASIGALPWAVRSLIAAAAALRQEGIAPSDLDNLVAGGLSGAVSHPLLARVVGGADLFTLWSVVLCGFGLSAAAGIGRVRSLVAVAIGTALFLLISSIGAR